MSTFQRSVSSLGFVDLEERKAPAVYARRPSTLRRSMLRALRLALTSLRAAVYVDRGGISCGEAAGGMAAVLG